MTDTSFQDWNSPIYSFNSDSKKNTERRSKDIGTLTEISSLCEKCNKICSSGVICEASTGTDTTDLPYGSHVSTLTDDFSFSANVEINEEALLSSLRNLMPILQQELSRGSKYFGNISRMNYKNPKNRSTLHKIFELKNEDHSDQVKLGHVVGSPNGKYLAFSIKNTHTGWCCHVGSITIHQINNGFNNPRTKSFETDSCVTILRILKPLDGQLLVAGTYNGKVHVIRVQDEKYNEVNFKASNDRIIQIESMNHGQYGLLILTCSNGALLSVWRFAISNFSYTPWKTFSLELTDEISCIDLRPLTEDEETVRLVIGFFGGHLKRYHGSLFPEVKNELTEMKGSLNDRSHLTISVQFSDFSSDIFATISLDHTIKLYSWSQNEPRITIWSDKLMTGFIWKCTELVAWNRQQIHYYNSQGRKIQCIDMVDCDIVQVSQVGKENLVAIDDKNNITVWSH